LNKSLQNRNEIQRIKRCGAGHNILISSTDCQNLARLTKNGGGMLSVGETRAFVWSFLFGLAYALGACAYEHPHRDARIQTWNPAARIALAATQLRPCGQQLEK
jgi:hypothetical protein